MLISREWLSEYIDLDGISDQQLDDSLTQLGLEVEEIHQYESLDDKIYVGEIKSIEPHPDASKLNLCLVDYKHSEEQVVCGAPNVKVGMHVAIAINSAVLPDGTKLKPSKIRGIMSSAMLLSGKELGISEDQDGLLSMDGTVGQAVKDLFPSSDAVFELSITPNRGDCLSYIGIARDLSAKLKRPLKTPEVQLEVDDSLATETKLQVATDIGCARFNLLRIDGVQVTQSPYWLRRRLEVSGVRSINLLVDISNYVMLETGQPNHFYDREAVLEETLKVRFPSSDETLTTLDGKEVKLASDDILIADGQRAIGLGGVMGGANSEVKASTTSLLLEVAYFDPSSVRKTAKRLALNSEASKRFERGIDVENIGNVALRAAGLLQKLGKEQAGSDVKVAASSSSYYPNKRKESLIALRVPRARSILAMPLLTVEQTVNDLKPLGIKLVDSNDERLLFAVPAWRHDISREIDLVEEVGRIQGFEKIIPEYPRMAVNPTREHPFLKFIEDTKNMLAAQSRMTEVITYPFFSQKEYEKLGIGAEHPYYPRIKLANALNEEKAWLQTTLIPSVLKSVEKNRSRGQRKSRIFQVAHGFFSEEAKSSADFLKAQLERREYYFTHLAKRDDRPIERTLLVGALDSSEQLNSWQFPAQSLNFYSGKQLIDELLGSFGLAEVSYSQSDLQFLPFLHPKASARLECNGLHLGFVGELHPQVSDDLGFGLEPLVLFELDLEGVFQAIQSRKIAIEPAAKFPPLGRDLAFEVDEAVSYSDFVRAVSEFPKKRNLVSHSLFDVYKGDKMQAGKKSMAFTFSFQAANKTLTEKEVDKEIVALKSWLQKEIAAEQR